MTDLHGVDTRFELDLRAVLADLAPETAPGSLRAAVAAVPGRAIRQAPARARAVLAVVGLAAAVVVAVVGIGLIGARLPAGPAAVSPTGVPSAVPTSSPAAVTFSVQVVTPDGSMATKAQTDAVGSVLEARLRAYGIGTFSWSATDDRLTFEVAPPEADPGSIASVRDLLGATGAFSIVLLGPNPVSPGDRVTGAPLFTGEAVTDARTGTDQGGIPTLDLTVDAQAAAALANATRTHVGDYLAVALDGTAVAVPVINAEISGGQIQISFAGDDTTAARLAAILQAGPLPLPVEAVTP